MVALFEGQRPAFRRRADVFLRGEEAALSRLLDALLEFAGRAYRRLLREPEKAGLLALYQATRARGAGHEKA
jgi:hypothetical protein